MGGFYLKSQRGKYPGATLNGETKLKAHECLNLKKTFCLRRIYNIPLQHLTRYVPQPQPYHSPLQTDFFSLSIPPPSCRTAEAEVKTLSSVSGLTRFDWPAFELHWQLWRHSFHHWGHHDPFHARQMLNTSRHRVDTESLSIQRAGLWHQQYAHRGWR